MMKSQAQLEDDGKWAWQVYDDHDVIDWDSGYSTYKEAKDGAERRIEQLESDKQQRESGQEHLTTER